MSSARAGGSHHSFFRACCRRDIIGRAKRGCRPALDWTYPAGPLPASARNWPVGVADQAAQEEAPTGLCDYRVCLRGVLRVYDRIHENAWTYLETIPRKRNFTLICQSDVLPQVSGRARRLKHRYIKPDTSAQLKLNSILRDEAPYYL